MVLDRLLNLASFIFSFARTNKPYECAFPFVMPRPSPPICEHFLDILVYLTIHTISSLFVLVIIYFVTYNYLTFSFLIYYTPNY